MEIDASVNPEQLSFFNRPPSLSVSTSPSISSWGIMHLGRTANATISLEGSSDPENDPLTCWIENKLRIFYSNRSRLSNDFDIDFPNAPSQFTLTIYLSDGNNPDVTWSFDVRLFNEIPEPEFEVLRAGETSANLILLDGSMVTDPEEMRFASNSGATWTVYSLRASLLAMKSSGRVG